MIGISEHIMTPNFEKQLIFDLLVLAFELGYANKSLNSRPMQMRRGDLNHPHVVAVFLIFASVIGMMNFVLYPVFSQNPSTTAISSNMTIGYNRTVTMVQTYQSIGFTTSSSLFTQIIVAFVTSTTFFTYVQITFTSSTSTMAYPAPPVRPRPNSGSLQVKPFSALVPGRLTGYGGSSSMLVVLMFAVFGLFRRKMGSFKGTVSESRPVFSV